MSIDLVADSLNERVRRTIRAEMAREGISQTDLARVLRQTQNRISRQLTGKQELTLRDVEEIAQALGVPLYRLFDLDQPVRRGRRVS